MASISKRESGAWQNTSYDIRATATDTITTLPTTIYGDGTNATISIKGNTVQSETPTPDSPIMPEGCGELDSGQYKIPISSGDTTTPVYLGEVETTRKIKQLVFKGDETENWGYSSSKNNARVFLTVDSMAESPSISTHYQFGAIRTYPNLNEYCINNASSLVIGVDKNSITSAADFKTYLAAQYAAGTPVTVWYVLEAEEIGIVNEPLMKIEDYADVVNNISIPTTDGANTLSVDTTVQPSEVSVNYHGWHMGTVHERTAGQWD